MKVYLKTVGCRVNQIETESLREKFAALGHTCAASPEEADLVVLNTCSVTAKADRDCLAFLRKAAACAPVAGIAVTGCLATLEPEKILSAAPGARLFANKRKDEIPRLLCGSGAPSDFSRVAQFHGHARAFVKVQDGCNLKCAYCLVNLARSEIKSKPLREAVSEIRALAGAGFSEIVLCGTRLGIYRCPDTGADLGELMGELFALEGGFRFRFSSIEAGELTPGLLRVLRGGGRRFCDYFHVPLQSGSDFVLRAMGRPYDTAAYRDKMLELKDSFPGAGLYADIIAGYPQETEVFFKESLAFAGSAGLSGLHVFSFSSRPGTSAASLKPLPASVVASRAAALRGVDVSLRSAASAAMAGSVTEVLVLRGKGAHSRGLASNFMTVQFPCRLKAGTLVSARITGSSGGICLAEVAEK